VGGKLQQRDMPGVLAQRRAGGQQLFEVVIPVEHPDHDTGRTLAIDQWLGQGPTWARRLVLSMACWKLSEGSICCCERVLQALRLSASKATPSGLPNG
jgi:hypothetical protein